MREVAIDTETTGLNYKSGDRVIEVGCVELVNHVATNNFLQFYCKVDKEISESAKKITGITTIPPPIPNNPVSRPINTPSNNNTGLKLYFFVICCDLNTLYLQGIWLPTSRVALL